jgi:predicted MFS family arabinose efflux permease
VTFAVLAMGVGAFALLQSLVIPVLTTVQHGLHTTQSAVTWVLTAYLLSASIMTPILGRVDDVITLVSAMRGLIHTVPGATPDAWQRFLDLHLAGMTARS